MGRLRELTTTSSRPGRTNGIFFLSLLLFFLAVIRTGKSICTEQTHVADYEESSLSKDAE